MEHVRNWRCQLLTSNFGGGFSRPWHLPKAISNPERFAEQRQWFGASGQSTGRSRDWQCGAQAAEGGPGPGGWSGHHQLRLVVYPVYPITYEGFYTSQVVIWDFWTINSIINIYLRFMSLFGRVVWNITGFFLAALKWYKWWYGTCDKLSINSLWFDPDPVPFHHILVIRDIFFQVAHASTNGKWVVWGPVVWNSKKIPLWRGWGFLGGNPNSNPKPHIYHYLIHSGRSTWNLQIHPFREENHLNQTIIFSFDSFIFGGVKAGKNCSWPIHHYTPQV